MTATRAPACTGERRVTVPAAGGTGGVRGAGSAVVPAPVACAGGVLDDEQPSNSRMKATRESENHLFGAASSPPRKNNIISSTSLSASVVISPRAAP